MTDERRTGEQPAPDPDAPQGDAPPPPLAPLVDQGAAAVNPAGTPATPVQPDDTTAQPTGSWQQAPPPPPIAPPVQPAVAWAPPPQTAVAIGGATPIAKVAGILLVVGGILGGLAGLAVIAFGNAVVQMVDDMGAIPDFEGSGDPTAFVTGFIVFFGAIILIYSLVYLIGGIGVLRSRDWGRILGIIVGILSGLVWLGSVTTPDTSAARDSMIWSLILFGIHAYIVVALLFFWRRRTSTV